MASEARRGLIRIAANYGRLFTSVCLGLLLVRIVIAGAGNDAWALIALLGATIGIPAMLQDIVRASMVRELGEAHHGGDDERFLTIYNSALLVTGMIGVIALVVLGIILVILPVLRIPPELLAAARWLVAAKGAEMFVLIVLGAPMNMYVATERMVLFNAWLVVSRACPVLAAVFVFVVKGIDDPARGLILYAVLSAAMYITVQFLAIGTIILLDRRLLPRPRRVRRAAVRELLRIGGWNASALTAISAHEQIGNILMNLFFGLFGNLIFGLTMQLTSYVRMLTVGVTFGLDAVSARLSTAGGDGSVRQLCYHATRLHGIVAMPAALGLVVLARPILETWLGDRIQDPARVVPATVLLIRIMTIGMLGRAISDGWLKILYGAGHVARYAPLVLAGAIINPIVTLTLFFVLPEDIRFIGAATTYSLLFTVIHVGLIPRLVAKYLDMRFTEVLGPLLRSALITAASAPALIFAARSVETWSLLALALVAAAFGIVYGALTFAFALDGPERRRMIGMTRRMLRV